MKILGITLEANKAIFCALEKDAHNNIVELATSLKKLELKDHLNSAEVRVLMTEIHDFFARENFDKIGIITRGTKGRFAASPISFKIEGLIQAFPKTDVEFVAPVTSRAFYKKNENPIEPKYGYQKHACDLGVFLFG